MKKKILILSSLALLFVTCFSFNIVKADSVTNGTTSAERNDLLTAYGLPDYSQFYYDDYYYLQEINSTMPYIQADALGTLNDAFLDNQSYMRASIYNIYNANLGEWQGGNSTGSHEGYLVDMFLYWDYFDRYLYLSKPSDILLNGDFYLLSHIYYWDELFITDIGNQPIFTFVRGNAENVYINFDYWTFNYDLGVYEHITSEYEISISDLNSYSVSFGVDNLTAYNLPLQELTGEYSLDGGWLDDNDNPIPTSILDLNISISFDGGVLFGGIIFDFATSNENQVGNGFIYYDELIIKGLFLSNLKPVEVVDFEDIDLVSWLSNSVASFMDFELFDGFSIGGLLGVFISLSLAVWILKVFLGG